MIDFTKKGLCKDCQYWRQYKTNPLAGKCSMLGAIVWPGKAGPEISITSDNNTIKPNPVSDFRALRTQSNFGCNCFYPVNGG